MTQAKAFLHPPEGAGPAVVFIHGFGADRLGWMANAGALQARATIHSVDLPGHGSAPNAVGDGSPETLARAVADELHMIEGPITVVGHSLGGAVALRLARMCPERIRALILIAPAGLGDEVDTDFLHVLPELSDQGAARALLERLVSRKRLISPAMGAHLLNGLQSPERRAALATIAKALADFPSVPWPAAVPVRLIWGEDDTINRLSAESVARLGEALLYLKGVGHLPQVEAAGQVNREIEAFLN